MKSTLIIGLLLAAAGCQKDDAVKEDEGTGSAINMNTQSAKPATNVAETSQGERDPAAMNALVQGESESDRSVTRQIRQVLMNHDKLSAEAKNVQVVTKDGVVTLAGDVENESEKALLTELAQGAPGVTRIDNHLTIEAE